MDIGNVANIGCTSCRRDATPIQTQFEFLHARLACQEAVHG
jgi:hypothetical protein